MARRSHQRWDQLVIASMNTVVRAQGLGKKYGRRWALTDCDLEVPAGHVVGLVGPNGAGKSTLLNLAVGMLTPSAGSVEVLGAAAGTQQAKVGYVAQDTPTYSRLSVAEHLKLGSRLNPAWDDSPDLKVNPMSRPVLASSLRTELALLQMSSLSANQLVRFLGSANRTNAAGAKLMLKA